MGPIAAGRRSSAGRARKAGRRGRQGPMMRAPRAACVLHRGVRLGEPRRGARLDPAWLDGRVSERTAYDAMLVVSELVTNSVVHSGVAAGDPVQLRANLDARILRLEVGDLGAGTDIVRIPPPDRLSAGGFGLAIVDSLGARWGVVHASGTRVWCELALPATA